MNIVGEFSYVFFSLLHSVIIKILSTWSSSVITVSAPFNRELINALMILLLRFLTYSLTS